MHLHPKLAARGMPDADSASGEAPGNGRQPPAAVHSAPPHGAGAEASVRDGPQVNPLGTAEDVARAAAAAAWMVAPAAPYHSASPVPGAASGGVRDPARRDTPTTAAQPKGGGKADKRPRASSSLATVCVNLQAASTARAQKAVVERPAAAVQQDASRGAVSEGGADRSLRKSSRQRRRLLTLFYLWRAELNRWTAERRVVTKRDASGKLVGSWMPKKPEPDWRTMAHDPELAIHLPESSVRSFFSEIKKEIRAMMKTGKLPNDHVRLLFHIPVATIPR